MKFSIFFFVYIFSKSVECEKILIIGAGASGIAAATRLIKNNITDFLIIEGEPRLGGRIHSIHIIDGQNGGSVDLGAEYVGGEIGNVVYEIAGKDLKKTDPSKKLKGFSYNGQEIKEGLCHEVLTFKDELREEFDGKQPISAKDAFFEKYNSTMFKKYENDPDTLKQVVDLIGVSENSFLYRQGAFDWSNILLNDHYKICEGYQGFTWNSKGYKHFLNVLMNKFGDEHRLKLFPIVYSTTVEKIIWKNHKNVHVYSKNGKTYSGEHVIFTPSVGVLKENHKELFEPNLPPNKIEAIEATGFEGAMKVILQYPKKWWDDDLSSFLFVWKDEDKMKISNDFENARKDNTWLSSFYRLFTVNGVPNVLIGWFVGPSVPEIEKMSNREIKNGVSFITKKFLGHKYNVSEPLLVIPSSWYSNPHFRGVYSFETLRGVDEKRQYQEDLAESLLENNIPKVLFAGEHTHNTHFSSVHGAVESGFTAADKLLKHLKRN